MSVVPDSSSFTPHRAAALPPVTVLIVDDSAVARSVFERILLGHPRIAVVRSVGSASEAIECLQHMAVDVVLLDIEMPGRRGVDALPDILRVGAGAKVLVVSSLVEDNGATAVAALAAGACDTLLKPGKRGYQGSFAQALADRIVAVAGRDLASADAPVVHPNPKARAVAIAELALPRPAVIGIGGSTGAISALADLLSALSDDVTAPILVTQHLPQPFIQSFAAQLDLITGRTVVVAGDGAPLRPGHVYIGPGDRHLGVARASGTDTLTIRLSTGHYPVRYTPAVDALFDSMADACEAGDGLAVVLSGMGRDGLNGARRLSATGSFVLAQCRDSSVVWGMPGAVVREGIALASGDPAAIAGAINRAYAS